MGWHDLLAPLMVQPSRAASAYCDALSSQGQFATHLQMGQAVVVAGLRGIRPFLGQTVVTLQQNGLAGGQRYSDGEIPGGNAGL